MSDLTLRQPVQPARPDREAAEEGKKRRRRPFLEPLLVVALNAVIVAGVVWAIQLEAKTSYLQSLLFTRLTQGMTFKVADGPSADIRYPRTGPYDERLGYTALPSFITALDAHHFGIERQARLSPRLARFIDNGAYAIYREKQDTGLTLLDSSGQPIYEARYPERTYRSFAAIPPLVVNTLLFIENRGLVDERYPNLNPAVDWKRFTLAVGGRIAGMGDPRLKEGGASTLATQIEKFRHSPGGRTGSVQEKLRQMVTAMARAYLDGPNTLQTRRRIVTTYLDSTPLSSRPGYGEVIGLGDGLWAWYGTEFDAANRVLASPAEDAAALAQKGRIYKQVLSLLLAQQRPSYYLIADRGALEALTDSYLQYLGREQVIGQPLRDAALAAKLQFRAEPPLPASVLFAKRKAVDVVRTQLSSLLRIPTLYSLDRLDLTATTTIDEPTQQRVTEFLAQLGDPDHLRANGMLGRNLLGTENPRALNYSVVLYERGADRNYVRVHADSLDEPFDINSNAKLILGSTAKLRTLVTYLDIITKLHDRYYQKSAAELQQASAQAHDPLTRWTTAYLSEASDRSLRATLEAAMQRRYSASPNEAFFTGGGMQVFQNFERSENGMVPTVEDAFENSINLAFIRIMRDIVGYYIRQNEEGINDLLHDSHDAYRQVYLSRFADQEGREYLNRFYDDYHALSAADALALLASRTRPVPRRLAVVFRSVRPEASIDAFREFLRARLPGMSLDDAAVEELYRKYAVDRYSLADRGYLAGIHPLELWLVDYLYKHPGAPRAEVMSASADERQAAYSWLFKTHSKRKQDVRIRILLEEDAFARILQDWRRVGYPFGQLVPSLATALGSSGDRPDALAELMGIIVNDGVWLPTTRIERLDFAAGTPYETDMVATPQAPRRVLAPEVAEIVRHALAGVVAHGTGARAQKAFALADGTPVLVGGKTGTGDNRYDRFGPGLRLIESRAVDRTATFVFYIGDRFFGTITAYVRGPEAAKYSFTSALAVQVLKSLAPIFQPLLDREVAMTTPAAQQASTAPPRP
ncbi:MAG TPA: transglycosylase domain-containing protein [Alphaproteobacteria bacterium]|nr:transglycosylase domain-containing protein [Alphaproteobacteria bacterium]